MIDPNLSGELIAAQCAIVLAEKAIRRAIEAKGYVIAGTGLQRDHTGEWLAHASVKDGKPFTNYFERDDCKYRRSLQLNKAVRDLLADIDKVEPVEPEAAVAK